MKFSTTLGLAVGALACSAAFAQTTVNVPPGAGPIPTPGATSGGAVLAVYNANQSLTRYLNLQIDDLQINQLTPAAGLVLDFGTIDLSAFGSTTGLRYSVLAGDYSGGDARDWQVLFSGVENQLPTAPGNADGMANALNNLTSFVNNTNLACGTTVPCLATSAQDHFAGDQVDLGGNLPFGTSGDIGSALSFWSLTGTGDLGDDPAALRRYQDVGGTTFGRWLLTTAGRFTYTFGDASPPPVPLPAAVWLLLSGLAGFGIFGRRQQPDQQTA